MSQRGPVFELRRGIGKASSSGRIATGSQGTHKSVRREAGVVSHEMVWKALPVVTRWIAESRAARVPTDYNEIQRQLASGAIEIRDLDLEMNAEKRHVLHEIADRRATSTPA